MKIIGYIQVPQYRFSTSSRISSELPTDYTQTIFICIRFRRYFSQCYIFFRNEKRKRKRKEKKRYIDIFRRGHK